MADADAFPRGPGSSRPSLLAFVVCCIPIACVALGWAYSRGQGRSARAEARALLLRQQDAWNAGDLEGFMTGYWDSEDLTFFSGGKVEKGYAALLTRYRKNYQSEGKEMGKLTFSELDIMPMGADDALARGRGKVVTSEEAFDGLFTLALHRFAGGWKNTHDHTSRGEKQPKANSNTGPCPLARS